jgi:DNA-binding NtrC family response regulator
MEDKGKAEITMNTRSAILVVDDEEIVRRGYARTLATDECHVETAWNGKAALEALEHRPYDVVLLDLRMPEMDGMSVLKTIKARWPESEVVIITGYPSIETAKEAVKLGACDYLAKPVAPGDVRQAARGALDRKRWRLRGVRATHGTVSNHGREARPSA